MLAKALGVIAGLAFVLSVALAGLAFSPEGPTLGAAAQALIVAFASAIAAKLITVLEDIRGTLRELANTRSDGL
jgi:hypothetical protein